MKAITNYTVDNRTFTIVALEESAINELKYGAVEDKYIDVNGKLTKQLNGLQVFASETVEQVKERINTQVIIDNYVSEGYNPYTAVLLAHGMDLETAIELGNKINATL